jgi:2,3-bisphosphoglycerate-independent phosphoglycerate mutase
MSQIKKQVALIILDGWGHSLDLKNNAIAQSQTPFYNFLLKKYPHTFLEASGEFVGLPNGQMGNSEIGHTTIGAGKIIDTDLVRINKSSKNDEFKNNEIFKKLFTHIEKHNSQIHIIGLLSEGGVHSHQEHLFAFLETAKKFFEKEISAREMVNEKNSLNGVGAEKIFPKIIIHAVTDGRDTDPHASIESFEKLMGKISETQINRQNIAEIATVSGRYYTMDRDNNFDRLAKFTDLFFKKFETGENETGENEIDKIGVGENKMENDVEKNSLNFILEKIKANHKDGKTDEHIIPFVVNNFPLQNNDVVFIFNFRSDRARMLTSKLLEKKLEMNLLIATMTEYSKDFDVEIVFPAIEIETTLATEIAKNNLTQAHIAETEKFPHATYFLNGGKEAPHEGEEHVLLESRKDVKTHNEAPEMRAEAIADEAVKRINDGVNFIFINFANPDMVGHTADIPAIITAVETVDRELKKVVDAMLVRDGLVLITADHGNAELNVDPITGSMHTAHTLNLVPCILTDTNVKLAQGGSLQDLAPTILDILNLEKPTQMTGQSLIVR